MTKTAAVDLFQSALRSNGAAIVNSNGAYKIVPVDQAPVGAIIQTANAPERERSSAPACRSCR